MLTEAVLGAIVEAVVGYALEQSGLADHVRSTLGFDPVERAFATALGNAYKTTLDEYPDTAARLFDASFLQHEAVQVLAQLLWRHGRPTGGELAAAWADSLPLQGDARQAGLREITPVAERFLTLLEAEAKKQRDLQQAFDRRAWERTAEHTAEMARILRERLPMEVAGAPTPPSAPLRTRVPDPRAVRLVGRGNELAWACRRLKAGDVAAIAGVRGIGGIGKTELAIAAAQALEADFEGRVIWLDCGPNDAYAIQGRLAAALGIELESGDLRVRADILDLTLRQQPPTLVVLDDVRRRHLADFACITPPCPPCALLITSRRYDLPLPSQAINNLDVLSAPQSRELLATLIPEGWLDAEPEAAESITELLEHIPLALTLAARRARRIAGRRDESARRPLATLLDELRERRIQVLNQGEDPTRPDLSVVVTFNASYDDLEPPDRARLRRLGVFARNQFELPALMAVWGDDETAARQALERLVNAGLVEEPAQDVWWMHDLLREYAADRLDKADPDEEQAARLAHAAYWMRYLDELELLGVEDWRDLAAHRPEVEQAAGWLLADWQAAPELAAALAVLVAERFEYYAFVQWEAWVKAGLAAAQAGGQRNAARRLQRSLGASLWQRGEVARAQELLQASLATARELLEAATTEEEAEAPQRGVAVTLG
ncbi:MAG: NB-ARC domain-containing protein, partial [Anaerolineae bacterium]